MGGVVVAVLAKEGQTLNSSQAVPGIVILAQLDVMRVKVQISEIDMARVKPGQNSASQSWGTLESLFQAYWKR